MSEPLAGRSVLVTRPREHAPPLVERLTALGAEVAEVPVIEIVPVALDAKLQSVLRGIPAADWLLFASRPAVRYSLKALRALELAIPPRVKLAVVGPGTAAALQAAGFPACLQPRTEFTSEALLAMPELQRMPGAEVVICRGVGGRDVLARTLSERGARVRFAELYERRLPTAPAAQVLEHWGRQDRRLAIVTSEEGLLNLLAMAGEPQRAALRSAPLVTVSERVALAARAQGFQDRVAVAPRPDDDGLVEAVLSVRAQEKDADGRSDR